MCLKTLPNVGWFVLLKRLVSLHILLNSSPSVCTSFVLRLPVSVSVSLPPSISLLFHTPCLPSAASRFACVCCLLSPLRLGLCLLSGPPASALHCDSSLQLLDSRAERRGGGRGRGLAAVRVVFD